MNITHEKIDFPITSTIEECVAMLLKYRELGELVYGKFNDVILYSDSVNIESAYILITGKTKDEFHKYMKEKIEDNRKSKREHVDALPALTQSWINKGRKVLSEDKWELWEEVVPVRLRDMYQGMELGSCLDIVEVLNSGGSLEEANSVIDKQGHSGASYGLVLSMVKVFADRGNEFYQWVIDKKSSK